MGRLDRGRIGRRWMLRGLKQFLLLIQGGYDTLVECWFRFSIKAMDVQSALARA